MVAAVLARILEIALHFAILGGLVDVALQLHHGRLHEAIVHAVIASICIVILAGAGYLAKKILGKNHSGLRLNVTCVLTREEPRAKAQRSVKRVTTKRKSP